VVIIAIVRATFSMWACAHSLHDPAGATG